MPSRASRLLMPAALLLVIALGLLFEALLARELLKRSHKWAWHAQPAQESSQWAPADGVCPRPWDPHHGDPHHARRERLTVAMTASACLRTRSST